MAEVADCDVQAFLDAINRHRIIRLGPAEYLQVRQLLARRPTLSRRELRAGLAALLATNEAQWRQIVNLFDLYFSEASPPPSKPDDILPPDTLETPEPEEPGRRERRSWWHTFFASLLQRIRNAPRRLWLAAIALLLSLGIAALVTLSLRPPELPSEELEEPKTPPEPSAPDSLKRWWILRGKPLVPEHSSEPIEIQPEVRSLDGRDALVISLSLVLVCVGLRWLLLPGMVERYRQAQAVRRHQRVTSERKRLAEQAEQRQAPLHLAYQVERYPPLPVSAAEDSAAILGRLFRSLSSADLDIPATVHATIQRGGQLAPVYLSQSVAGQFLVLLDIERGDHPWLAGTLWLLERWAALGVRFARYDFRFDPLFVSMPATGNSLPLQRLARHAGGEPLLIISRSLSTQGLRGRAAWLEELDAWPVKAWLDPDPRPLSERCRERREIRELERLGLQRFPFSEAGLLALARYLAEGGQGVRTPAWEPLKPLSDPEIAKALPRWALLAALVPDANWDQLDYLRRRFPDLNAALPAPRYLQRLLDWVAREDNNSDFGPESEDGRTLVLSAALIDRLIREQRQRDAGLPTEQRLEAQGRRLLLEQLDATRPDDELLRQFWEVKRVSHLLRLEPERALARLPLLLEGAAGAELLRAIEVELERQKELPLLESGVQDQLALVTGHAAGRLHLGELLGRPWRGWLAPGLIMSAAAAVGFFVMEQWPDLQTWLLRPPTTIEASGVMPAIREVELVLSEFQDKLVDGSLGPTMVVIPAGEFMMGSPEDEEGRRDNERQHLVSIERPFAMGKYEVTVDQFRAFVKSKDYKTEAEQGNGCYGWTGSGWKLDKQFNWRNPGYSQNEDHPVVCVSWNDALTYAEWLSEQTGETYRLPTEAEWEYAVRAGTQTARYWGDASDLACRYANVHDETSKRVDRFDWTHHVCDDGYAQTAPVGRFQANAFALHDMLGNVWEWTCSVYDKSYGGAEQEFLSKNRADYGSPRVRRGGSWSLNPHGVRAANRSWGMPGYRGNYQGFRLARQF